MQKDIDVSEYSGGTKIVLHQLYSLFGGENPGIITNSTPPNSTDESNTLASLLEQYSRSISEGGGIGYIGLEWKGPFSFHPDILQHAKRMTSLTGSAPSMNCGTLHHLNHGYITLENLLYIFPLTEQDDTTNSAIRGHDTFKEDEIKRISKPLSITLPLAIKAVSVTFPKFGMFSEKVQFILCVLTEKSAHLYGICYEKKMDHNRLQIPKYELVTTPLNREGIDESLTIQCSLPYRNNPLEFLSLHGTLDGRFFFLLKSDCNIYEIVYQSKEGWITPYCYIYTHQVHSSMLKRILFRYTILRFLPLSQPLTLVSFAPCGYIITMDIHQNLYLLTYSSNLQRDCLLNKISPWGRMVNSLGYWLPKSESNLYVSPTQWDNFLNSQIKEDIYSKSSEIRSKSIDFESNNPAKIKILAVLSKQQLNYILEGNNVKGSLEDNQRNNDRFLISNIDLSFSADYHLILTVFMKCGTRLLFRCSCNEDEASSFTYTQITNSKKSVISPKRQAESSNPSIFDQFKPRYRTSSIIFGFWLIDILNNSDTKVVIQSSYYKNGLTIISYPLNSIDKEKQSKSLESTMNNINNQYQIEIRLLSSVPADLTTSSHKFNSLGIQNSGSRLRYSKYSNNLDPNSDIGEPIILGVNEPIIDIYEVPTDLYNKIYQDSGGTTNEMNRNIPNINPSILLEYGGNYYGPKASYDLLGWCKDRYIILMGYTHYYGLTIGWNGLQQAFGSTGLFMQIIQEVKQGTNFRRLVHPEDSYLSCCNSYLTSPWIEAITGALAFSLRSTLEMPILISMNKVSCTFTIKTLDHCIYTLQNMMHFLSRSQNIIGTELFNIWNPPKSSFTKPKYFFEVVEEVFTCQVPLKMIEITTNILKSITFIIHMLLQLFRLLYYYQESPLNIRDEVIQEMKNERALDIILKTPTLFLVTSNDYINCLRKFSSYFINSLVISMIESKRENTTIFNNELSTIQKSIHWLLCPKTRKFLTRSILSFELGFYNSKYSHSSINSANSILEKFLHLANPSIDSTNPSVSQKYWLDFLKDPTRHELLENAFCTLTVEPHNKFYDATILLIELIQFFDKEIGGNRSNFETNSLNMTSQLNIPQYVNLLVKSWDFSMCDALIEFIENKLSNDEDEVVQFACKVISECLKAMTSLKIGLEIFCIFLKHLLNSFLMKLFNNLKYLVFRKHGICLCNFLMKDLAYILRYCNNILPDYSNKGVLSIITDSFIIGIDGNSANESYIEAICSISLELAIQSKYSPFYLLAVIFNLYNSMNKTMAYNNVASILCALGLDNEISCQVKCFNPFTSLELLDIVQYIVKNKISKVIEDTDIQNIFILLPDKKSALNKSYLNLEDMYIILTEIINSLEYLQLPVLNYINSITNNTGDYDYDYDCDFSNEGLKRIDDIQVLPIKYVQYYLNNNIVQSYSEMLSIIYRCPHIQLFSIIASLLESTTIIRTEENVDAFCSFLSDMLLQTLLPPKSHPIYQLVSDYDTIFPILETIFGFNGDNLLDSFLKLLVYIEKPLIGINGTELLDSLALMKTINKQKDANLQTLYIFQQLYVLLAVFEFSVHYFKTKKALYKRIYPDELNTISIKIWRNKWNVSYHLLLDTYVSLIEACCTTNISNNPFSLIVDRLISLECPLVTVNIADTFEDFVQHLRLCATTVIIIWVKEDLQNISSNQKDIIVNFISTVIPFLSANTNKILANHEALINTLQDITLKLSNNKKSC